MNKFDKILEELKRELDGLSFSEAIREGRDRLGLMQYRLAEHLKMSQGRLKNLETGYFRVMPSPSEIRDISEFYNFPIQKMIKKAEKHVDLRNKKKKIRPLHGGFNKVI